MVRLELAPKRVLVRGVVHRANDSARRSDEFRRAPESPHAEGDLDEDLALLFALVACTDDPEPTFEPTGWTTLPRSARDDVRALCEAVGLTLEQRAPDVDSAGGASPGTIGFIYVDDAAALTPAQMRIAPWLELVVGDVAAASERLAKGGLARLEYIDPAHPYFVGPGGLVFRLAAS